MSSRLKKYGLTAVACVIVCTAIGYVLIVRVMPWCISRSLDFQAYSPTYLPAGIRLTGHETTVHDGGTAKYVVLQTNTEGFTINEQPMTSKVFSNSLGLCNYNHATNYCTILRSSHGQVYDIATITNDSGKPALQAVSWHKNGTVIVINLFDQQAQKYPATEWGHMIDGFKPVDYGDLKGTLASDNGG